MKRMLFNATQQEELRVAIVDGQKLIDIDIEATGREQRKSNIYKGVITRIEPSLEACFVNYGEERHGFLPFKEVARTYFKEGIDVRNASIKEALREGQEIIVQVEKEERGNKGAALTSFISLAGRYLVLMPNNPRGGGVSRRVEGEDRQELRETMDKLDLPNGMSVIARTAGIGRNVDELQWDLNYLMQLWRAIEGAGQSGSGAFLIYQESSLVIRAIRDYFQPDIGEILIDTDDIHEQAQQFMAHVMPDMVHRVKRYHDDVPLFSRFQIEHQIETAYSRTVPLPSGGAIVIDHTEALVSVDVNSARATRGSDIETTAFYTNLEAADEVARQLRLRDLGGLIVIDFIDMENAKNQREVESRLKDALHHDRARVQMGKISRFGLMELSRQRLRPSLSEGSHVTCPRCNGTGHIRDTESSALQVLRIIQEEAMKENSAAIHVQAPVDVAAFLLNEKRGEILKIETRHRVTVIMIPNKHLETPHYKLERIKHDDPRLDDAQASYAMAEQAETDIGYSKRQKEDVKPRQEAVVKGITPDQPAPIVERKVAAPVEQPPTLAPESGFFSKIWSFFRTKPVEATPVAAPADTKSPQKRDHADRNGRNRNGRNRNGRNRNEREERDGAAPEKAARDESGKQEYEGKPARPPRPPREPKEAREPREPREGAEGRNDREPREPREPRQPREGREPREPKEAREPRENREPREGSEAREPRQPRTPRPPREERKDLPKAEDGLPLEAALATGVAAAAVTDVEGAETAQVAGNQVEGTTEEGEPRRRRRRGGRNRNRRDRDGENGGENADGESAEGADGEESAQVAAPAATVAAPADDNERPWYEKAPAATPAAASAPAPAEAPVAVQAAPAIETPAEAAPAPVAVTRVQETVAAVEAPAPVVAEPVAEVAPSAAVAPVEAPAPAAVEPALAAPVVAPAPQAVEAAPAVVAPTPAPAPVAAAPAPAASNGKQWNDLNDMLSSAGLTLASTDPEKLRAAQAAAAQIVPAPRVPRERKPLPPQSTDPLVQVETRR
ncbi:MULTISPECIES: Rne/Rng family ribonuclease [unclassified Herbaspirillum]|uniref:Rne/Rng family ribonuclease n=1 Tax=unclassified Herbaspirillum TaxID=2624150 RepID=UPI000E2F3759|nr:MULTISPECIES: Rne/Rng family ribonuclease [unclassified Herbaspirillum]RFB68880.1 Rne/Rng family ribonuclease [Herbaspirillum sp. 3R-3a1]TFI05786.1 Rne/Rng family ribonuclease [Herbaspirillum sp. 3R11]TFI13303.1 Rne/Rng family ribonuclease [Herbaspirillum sp. 3R-11]TFI28775.1 Rne/Rng family ribonuclease [Herbaspirillum sp. 3C11]